MNITYTTFVVQNGIVVPRFFRKTSDHCRYPRCFAAAKSGRRHCVLHHNMVGFRQKTLKRCEEQFSTLGALVISSAGDKNYIQSYTDAYSKLVKLRLEMAQYFEIVTPEDRTALEGHNYYATVTLKELYIKTLREAYS